MEPKKKVLGTIKLNQLSKNELEKRQMNALKGGSGCACWGCGCTNNQAGNEETDATVEDGKDW